MMPPFCFCLEFTHLTLYEGMDVLMVLLVLLLRLLRKLQQHPRFKCFVNNEEQEKRHYKHFALWFKPKEEDEDKRKAEKKFKSQRAEVNIEEERFFDAARIVIT